MAEMSAKEAAEEIERFANEFDSKIDPINYSGKTIKVMRYAASICRKVAAGELREVVHGHWNHTSRPNEDCMGGHHDVIECSICKEDYDSEYDYCPSCGNPMDGKAVAMKKAKRPLNPAPCVYKHSCGIEICMEDDCAEYKPKKRGEPYYGDDGDWKKGVEYV